MLGLFRASIALLTSAKGKFIYVFLTKWYLAIMIPAILVVYYVIKGLDESGFLASAEAFIALQMEGIIRVAQECTPKILKLDDFLNCL